MTDYHVVFGAIAVALTFLGYALYLRSMFRDGTKPHPFTWLLFAILDGTIFVAQVLNDGGAGAWPLGVAACMNGLVFVLALQRGEKRITNIDWSCLGIALVGIGAWTVTSNALFAVMLATLSDIVAKVPTFRKSYVRPHEESITIWALDVLKFSLAIVALSTISWTTALFPAEIVLTNALLVGMILWRRRQLAAQVKTG